MEDHWDAPDLSGRVAVVAGASRGVGRGIAEVLGGCGVTVYITGRSTRSNPTRGNPEWTIEAVADAIKLKGGKAVPVQCDHRSDDEVEKLFELLAREQGYLDILVNNLVGWSDSPGGVRSGDAPANEFIGQPVWRQPLWWWDANFDAGVRAHLANCRFGIPLMLDRPGGVVIFTSERPRADPLTAWDTILDLRAHTTARLVSVLAPRLHPYKVAALLLYPGWTRTEDIVAAVTAGSYPLARTLDELHVKTVSPHYAGRATAALAADPAILMKSGQVLVVGDLAKEYNFTDIDGRQPNPL